MKIHKILLSLALVMSAVGTAFSQSMIITGGNDHGIALCNKGQILAWGYNAGNRLCLLDANDAGKSVVSSPSLVNTGNLTFSMLSAGSGGHSVALSCNKVVYCWGGNDFGQCGRPAGGEGSYIEGGKPVPVYKGETEVGYDEDGKEGGEYLGNVKYITATTAASLAILDDGTGRVVIWGGNMSGGGGVIETPSYTPVFVRDANGDPIKNVIHITGGDNNVMLIVGSSPEDKVGTVYSIGNWNGRGGNGQASSFTAAPVEIGDGTGKKSSKKNLTNVRNCGIADVGAFAVDGTTGYVYGWGNGGWGCMNGLKNNNTSTYAEKVISGEYETISGEPYLTNVTQVIGGNGCGTAVTSEGYVLFWGNNTAADGTTRSGGVAPNSSVGESTCKSGPVFANYCAGEHGYSKETRVDDAIAIARGDLYGFMVNADGKFYAWGSTARPGTGAPAHVGNLGIGKDEYVSTCFREIEINCTPQDICPEAFMVGPRYKCPGEPDTLFCGFTATKGSEDNYYYQWSKDGVILNTSKPTDDKATRKADKYNVASLIIDEEGQYRVDIMYVGLNVPCDNCPETFAEVEVIDMQMPIDTLIKTSCVAEPLSPTAADQICYNFSVNTKFYKSGANTSWQVFSSKDPKKGEKGLLEKPLDIKAGGDGEFCVTGADVTVNDNKDELSKDTTYSIWLEDVTKQDMHIYKGQKTTGSGSFQSYGLLLQCWSDAELASFDLVLKSYSGTATAKVTPTIYKAVLNDQGEYVVGSVFLKGETQTLEFGATETAVTVDCGGMKLTGNSQRGAVYVLGMTFDGNCNMSLFDVTHEQNSPLFGTPVKDDLTGTAVLAIGATANQYNSMANPSDKLPYVNVTFSKLTDYDCGRIELTSRYWCPPCNRPDKLTNLIETSHEKLNATGDTIKLCKEDPDAAFEVNGITKASDPSAKFDILWYDDPAMTKELKLPETASSSDYSVAWLDLTEGESRTYYVKVRDHDKSDASSCYVFDSIVVKANPKPKKAELEFDPYCEGALSDATSEAMVKKAFEIAGFISKVTSPESAEITAANFATDLKNRTAGVHTYDITLVDEETGCESDPATFDITVNAIPDKPLTTELAMLKANETQSVASGATILTDHTATWYTKPDLTDGNASAPKQDKSTAGTYYYYVSQTSPEGCVSDTATVTVVVNDAPKPNVRDTIICVGELVDVEKQVTKLSAEYTLNWYTSEDAEKGTGLPSMTFSRTTPGVETYYVSQTNTTTNAESDKNKFTVEVRGVDKAKVEIAETTYCKGADAANLQTMVSAVSNEASYLYADGFEWTTEGGAPLSAADMVPTTAVGVSTSSIFNVKQTYTIPTSGDVCKGENVQVTVNVTVVDKPVVKQVNYLKTDAADNGGKFKDLLSQKADAATALTGCSLVWYEADGTTQITGTPVPPYDPSLDKDVELYYWVKQVDANGCESELEKVTVVISSSPTPEAIHVAYCEGDDSATPLSATIVPADGESEGNYELVWYKENPNNKTTAADKAKLELTAAPTPSVEITDGSVKQIYSYWVAQRHTLTKAVSRAIEVCDTVFAKPQLITKNPSPVCSPATVNLKSKELWSCAYPEELTLVMAWTEKGQSNEVESPETIAKSGTYYAQAYFLVRGKQCVSNLGEINVDIHFLEGLAIDASPTTCPDKTVDLKAVTDKVNPSGDIKYTWTSADNGDSKTLTSATYTTPALPGPADKKYTYTLTASAGACVDIPAKASHTITIGDGPVTGSVIFSEAGNSESTTGNGETVEPTGMVFYSCGNPFTLDVSNIDGDKDFVWTENNAPAGTGATLNVTDPKNTTYHVAYTKTCATGFDIQIINVPLKATSTNTDVEICEGDNFEAKVNVVCSENSYRINWYKDKVSMGVSDPSISFTPALASNNGVYSYEVTNRGCKVEGEIANGAPLHVKPFIKFNVPNSKISAATETPTFVASRDSLLSVKLDFEVPFGAVPQNITWTENGAPAGSSNPLSLKVDRDHTLKVEVSDDNYCSADTMIQIYVDARLQLSAQLDAQMCASDSRELTIDTAGTGAFFFPDNMKLYVEETSNGQTRIIDRGWNADANGIISINVAPEKDATYVVHFEYSDETGVYKQSKSVEKSIIVLPPIEIEVPEGLMVCGDGSTELDVKLVSYSPSDITLSWEGPSILSENRSEITVNPQFQSEYGDKENVVYTVTASYSTCHDLKKEIYVQVHRPLEGNIIAPEIICEGDEATVDATSYSAYEYKWSCSTDTTVNTITSSYFTTRPSMTSIYRVEMLRGECKASDKVEVKVSSLPHIVQIDSLYFNRREFQVAGGTAPYVYWYDGGEDTASSNSVFEKISYGLHTAHVKDDAGCMSDTTFVVDAPAIKIPNILTPNGDGVNEYFTTDIIRDAFPNAVISIYDRWGKLISRYNGSELGWDGTYNGKLMPSTDYWYEIEVKELKKTFTGHFTLLRQ